MSAETLGAAATGLRQLGQGVSKEAQTLHEINEKQAVFEAELQAVETENTARERLAELKKNASEGAEGFTEKVGEEFDNWLPELMNKAPDSIRAKKTLQVRYTGLKNKLLGEAQRFQAESKTAMNIRRFEDAQIGVINQARVFPERMGDFLEQMDGLSAGAPFPDEQTRAQYATTARLGVVNSSLDGWVTKFETEITDATSVASALSALKEGVLGFRDDASPRNYDQALTRLENRLKGLEVESSANFGKDIADAKVTIQNHGYLPPNITYARALEVYKGDEKAARRVMDELGSDLRVYGLRQRMAGTSQREDLATAQALFAGAQGEGADFKEQDRQEFDRARQVKWQAIEADPVAYVFRTDPSIADQWRRANELDDDDERSRVLNLLDAKQASLEIPYYQRRFLGKGAAQQVAERLYNMNWEDAANEIEAIQVKYKEHLAPVLRELEEAGVDPLMVGLGYKDSVDDVGLRRLVAEFGQAGVKTLRDNAGELNARDIDAAIAGKMPEFNRTLYHAGRAGQEIIQRERQMVEIVAYGLHQKGGKSADEVATDAYNMVLGNRYDLGATYRAPKGELGLVERGISARVSQAWGAPEMFAPVAPGRFATEKQIADSPIMQQHLRDAARRNALENGVWVNTDTEAGPGLVRLAPDDRNAGGYAPVKLADGSDWVITFEELRQAPPIDDPLQSGDAWILP
jgi:hypothetical protein